MEKDEIKTGKGWLELSREIPVVQAGPIKLEDLKKMLEEVQESELSDYDTYWVNVMNHWSPAAIEVFNRLIEEEAKQFLNNPKNKKYFK